jgi:UDP-glucose 4-epimerase
LKVLVIGGAGYIGSHVAREFLDRGDEVAVFDNLSSGVRENLFPESRFVMGDILDYPALEAATRGMDAIVHLAAFKAAGESMIVPEKYSLNNIAGTVNILNAAVAAGVRKLVFSSSAATYGEPEYLPIDERHPTNPENYYGFTKLEIERIMGWYDRLKGLKFASLRYFNASGYDASGRIRGLEKNPANLIPIIMEVACGIRPELVLYGDDYPTEDGTCVRDYVHVSDLATAHALALDAIGRTGASLTVNLGSERGFSVKQVLDRAREITGRPIPAKVGPRRPGDPARLVASSALASERLGWKATRSSVDEIVKTTWDAYVRAGLAR